MVSPAFLSGQTAWTVWPTICSAWKGTWKAWAIETSKGWKARLDSRTSWIIADFVTGRTAQTRKVKFLWSRCATAMPRPGAAPVIESRRSEWARRAHQTDRHSDRARRNWPGRWGGSSVDIRRQWPVPRASRRSPRQRQLTGRFRGDRDRQQLAVLRLSPFRSRGPKAVVRQLRDPTHCRRWAKPEVAVETNGSSR